MMTRVTHKNHHTWLMRQNRLARIVTALFVACFLPVLLLVAATTWHALPPWGRTASLAVEVLMVALATNGVFSQGARIDRDHVVLETILGCARIPLEEVAAVHVDAGASIVVVDTNGRYYRQTITTKYGRDVADRRITVDETEHRGLIIVHEDSVDVYSLRPTRFPSFRRGAILATLMKPIVAIPVGLAVLLGLFG